MPKGIPLTEEEQVRRRREIFKAAVHLFLDKGFNETSMREIAEAAGMGKSTLYDYFSTKDDILLSVVEDELQNLTEKAKEISHQPLGAKEKFRQIIFNYLDYLVNNEVFYTKLSIEVQRLGQNKLVQVKAQRHAYQEAIRNVIDEGIQEGYFRPVDSLLVARIILAGLSPAVYTTRKNSNRTQMMADAFDLILRGLLA
jgi:TetR/AcrR family transcriptional regulator, cholesterol catabolism regulator